VPAAPAAPPTPIPPVPAPPDSSAKLAFAPPPVPLPEAPLPVAPKLPTPRAAPPRTDLTPPAPAAPLLDLPRPVPLPQAPAPQPPLAQAPPRSRSPASSGSGFPAPQAWSLGPAKQGPSILQPYASVSATAGGPDWRNAFSAWVEKHKYYPSEAARLGQDGTVEVKLVVDRTGKVESIQLESGSGSPWLDLAAQGMFRGQTLPPFPAGTTEPDVTVHLTMHYVLIR
jgi:protein TonB